MVQPALDFPLKYSAKSHLWTFVPVRIIYLLMTPSLEARFTSIDAKLDRLLDRVEEGAQTWRRTEDTFRRTEDAFKITRKILSKS